MERGRGADQEHDPFTVTAAAPPVDYNSWTVAQLQDELTLRGLATDGLKADLVARLEADDAAKAAAGG